MKVIGSKIISLENTDSSNKYASKLLNDKDIEEGTVVYAKHQSKGKGYANNSWYSEKKNSLTATIILKPFFLKAEKQFLIHKLSALAALEVLKQLIEENEYLKIKWPNDLYYKHSKIGGILTENKIVGDKIVCSIIGIGININPMRFPKEIPNPISLAQITQKKYTIDKILKQLCSIFNEYYNKLKNNPAELDALYIKNLFLIGEYKQYFAEGKRFKGKITGIDHYGFLEIITEEDQKKSFDIKEIKYILDDNKEV